MDFPMGVCSWSLEPRSPADLAEKVQAVGVERVQLALEPIRSGGWGFEETIVRLARLGIEVRSVMMQGAAEDYTSLESIRRTGGLVPDEHWERNLACAESCARLARRFGVGLVTLHVGFLPEDRADPVRGVLLGRVREVADRFAAEGVVVGLETGQESARTLLAVLEELDRQDVGVNFDPANMVLYDQGDPVEALRLLAPVVRQLHVKDALRARVPGTGGEEVPVGNGEVDWDALLALVRRDLLECDLMVERESGTDRLGDIRAALRHLEERW